MNKQNIIYVAVPVGIILAVLSIIFGGIMPIQKSSLYISGLQQVPNMRSTQEFREAFGKALNYPSPVGQEEVTKYLESDILGIVSQNNNEAVARDLVAFVEPYAMQDNTRHLIAMGEMYGTLWNKFHKEDDYKKALDYYTKAYGIAPKLPPILYSMLSLYRAHGDAANMQKIGQQILGYWDDPSVKAVLGIK
jgi:tetratricopeptide (TPR) repeat protein